MNTRRGSMSPVPVGFPQMVANEVIPPFIGTISGEVTVTKRGMPLGVARFPGTVTRVAVSVLGNGKDDSSVPAGEVNVKINGTTCLLTKPKITHVSGEASVQKTTYASAGDTGITAGVVSETAKTFAQGDVITWDFIYTGTTTPTIKMHNVSVIVEILPL